MDARADDDDTACLAGTRLAACRRTLIRQIHP
jgi:hypothetical protein